MLPGNYQKLLRFAFWSALHSQRSYKIKNSYSGYNFNKATSREERNASPITTAD
jgi:hypothetical protein